MGQIGTLLRLERAVARFFGCLKLSTGAGFAVLNVFHGSTVALLFLFGG
jgi:hypothetical protein